MDKFSIEDKIRQRLKNHQVEVDKSELIERLGLQKKNKRRGIIWIPLALLVLSIPMILIWFHSSEITIEKSTQVLEQREKNGAENKIEPKSLDIPKQEIAIEDKSINSIPINSIPIKSNLDRRSVKQKNQSKTSRQGIDNGSELSNQFNSKNTNNSTIVKIKKVETDVVASFSNPMAEIDKAYGQKVDRADLASKSVEINELIKATLKNATFELDPLQTLNVNPFQVKDFSIPFTAQSGLKEPASNLQPSVKSFRFWSVEPAFTYGKYRQRVQAKNTLDEAFAAMRNESETALEYLMASLLVNYHLESGIYLTTGIQFQGYNYQVNFLETKHKKVEILDTAIVKIDYIGDTTFFIGQIENEEIIKRSWTVYNQLNLISIPILIGYQHNFGQFAISGEMGCAIAGIVAFKGKLANPDGSFTQHNPYSIAPHFFYHTGAGCSYQMNEKWSLKLKAIYGQNLGSFTSTNYQLKQTNKSVGLRISVDYRW